ncbi:hypothetical protein ABMA27_009224 [Loxostege sticticalis]|uniref:Gustatory receptor n=1 Tax=Loxostege sticticalis TaxID=481309 RepID=A0ABR3HAC4_LOXSC
MDRLKEIYDYVLHPKEELYYVEKDIRAFFLPLHIPHIVMFQSKYRTCGSFISKNRYAYNFINWIIFSGLTILYIVTDIIIITLYSFVYVILTDLILIAFDFMIVYAIRGMTLLRHSVVCWIEESKVRNSLNSSDAEEFAVTSVDLKEMFESYCDLADAFLSYKNVFAVPNVPIRINYLHQVFSNLWIQLKINLSIFDIATVTNFLWGLKCLILIWLLGLECDRLYSSLNDVNVECLMVLAHETCSGCREMCKNILRMNRVRFTKVTACSLFFVDATLILSFGNLVSTYLIVFLLALVSVSDVESSSTVCNRRNSMTLLRHSVVCWIEESKVRNSLNSSDAEEFAVTSVDLKEMFEAYCDLADAFLSYKNVFAVPNLSIFDIATVTNFLWGLKCLILIWLLGLECDRLYSSLNEVNVECLMVLAHETCSGRKQLCKNILRINRVRFAKVTVCSLFFVDATLLLSFGNMVSTYLIVLLQFNYLNSDL